MIDSDVMFRIAALIGNNVPKNLSPVPINTPELNKFWDELSANTQDLRGKGYIIDVPFEAPSVDAVKPLPNKKAIARDEVKTFIKFLSKSPTRPFEFVHVDEIYGEVLNKFVKAGDLDSARMYAERYLA